MNLRIRNKIIDVLYNLAIGNLWPFLFLFFIFNSVVAQHSTNSLQRFEFSSPHMGTVFNIVLYSSDSKHAALAARKAFEKIAELDSIMSDYKSNSELNQLSSTAGKGNFVKVSNDLWEVLATAKKISKTTKGAFDVTIGPMVKLWRRSFRQQELPDSVKLALAKQAVGYKKMVLDQKEQKVKLKNERMQLDLGGIAKGYAADKALEVLNGLGIKVALVDAGGDIVLGDPPPNKTGWKVALELNGKPTELLLANTAIATSGDLYKYVEIEGIRYSHIIDPNTGLGVEGQFLVTVIANNGMLADALASALSVMGPRKGLKKIRKYGNPAALYVQNIQDRKIVAINKQMEKLIRVY